MAIKPQSHFLNMRIMGSHQYFINFTLASLYALDEGGGTSAVYWYCHGIGSWCPRKRTGKKEEIELLSVEFT